VTKVTETRTAGYDNLDVVKMKERFGGKADYAGSGRIASSPRQHAGKIPAPWAGAEGFKLITSARSSEPAIFPESPWHQTSRFIPENVGIRI
jgi:hypothetical protein